MSFEALNFSITLVLTPQEEVDDLHFRHFPGGELSRLLPKIPCDCECLSYQGICVCKVYPYL